VTNGPGRPTPTRPLRPAATVAIDSPKTVAERLGHATPALVMNTYGHVTDRMQKDATTAMEAALAPKLAPTGSCPEPCEPFRLQPRS
jgi:integrase